MRVIGIDPGTIRCGYGIVDYRNNRFQVVAFGVVACPRQREFPERLAEIFTGLRGIIEKHTPDCAAIEEAFTGKSVQSTLRVAESRGVAILSAALDGLKVTHYSPAMVKKAVVGSGTAHKSQVQKMVKVILGLPELPQPEDAADALAIAICHCHRYLSPGALR